MAAAQLARTDPSPSGLTLLVELVRDAVDGRDGAAARVAAALRLRPPTRELLTASRRQGDPTGPTSQILHTEELFSVVALVCRPGQQTTIHDHLAWGVVTVVQGTEQETVYRELGEHLHPVAHSTNPTGSVTAFSPPGDIHRVGNRTGTTAISLHVYGTDLRAAGSSVRRTYDLPIARGSTPRGPHPIPVELDHRCPATPHHLEEHR